MRFLNRQDLQSWTKLLLKFIKIMIKLFTLSFTQFCDPLPIQCLIYCIHITPELSSTLFGGRGGGGGGGRGGGQNCI